MLGILYFLLLHIILYYNFLANGFVPIGVVHKELSLIVFFNTLLSPSPKTIIYFFYVSIIYYWVISMFIIFKIKSILDKITN